MPRAAALEADDCWTAAAECLSLLGARGCLEPPTLAAATRVSEELAYVNYGLETTLASSLSCIKTLRECAAVPLAQRYLEDLVRGREVSALCMTEPQAGSDVSAMKTTIREEGDELVLDGHKRYISNASVASLYVVYGVSHPEERPGRRLSAVAVPAGTPGLSFPRMYHFMGRRGCRVGEVRFEGCRVPAANLLGEPGQGFTIMLKMLNFERILLGGAGLGVARSAFDIATRHARQRHAFGQPLACKQLIWDKVAEMSWRLEASRLLTARAARLYDEGVRGKDLVKEAAMAKLVATETACFCANQTVQILGGDGITREYGRAEQIYRDARALPLVGGTTEIVKYLIAGRELPGIKLNL